MIHATNHLRRTVCREFDYVGMALEASVVGLLLQRKIALGNFSKLRKILGDAFAFDFGPYGAEGKKIRMVLGISKQQRQ